MRRKFQKLKKKEGKMEDKTQKQKSKRLWVLIFSSCVYGKAKEVYSKEETEHKRCKHSSRSKTSNNSNDNDKIRTVVTEGALRVKAKGKGYPLYMVLQLAL